MAKFTSQFILLIILLFLGILMGMNFAEKGIYDVAGSPDANAASFRIINNDEQVEVEVMGKKYELNKVDGSPIQQQKPTPPKPETKKVDELGVMSKVGYKLGSFFQSSAEKGMNAIAGIFE